MDNKNIIKIILIFTLFTHCTKTNNNKDEYQIPQNTDNAAHYYIHAFESLRTMGSYTDDIINKTISNGWYPESDTALDFIFTNKKSLGSIKNAAQLNKCDFNIHNIKYSFKQNVNLIKLLNLSNLHFLNIEYKIKQEKITEAIDLYLDSITFARHVSLSNKLMAKMVCITIELNFIQSINRLIETKKIDKNQYEKVFNRLNQYLESRFTTEDQLQNEKTFYFEALDYLVSNQIKTENNAEKNKKITAFISNVDFFGKETAENYFILLKKASIFNKEDNWNKVDLFVKGLDHEIEEFIGDIQGIKGISDLINNNPEKLKMKFAKQMAVLVLKLSIVDMRIFVEKNRKSVKELIKLKDKINSNRM